MKYNLVQKTFDPVSITAPVNTEWFSVAGCDSVAAVMTASEASTPGTATIQLQGSLDKISAMPIGTAVTVAANGAFTVTQDRPPYLWYRVAYAIASGSYTSTLKVLCKGDKDA